MKSFMKIVSFSMLSFFSALPGSAAVLAASDHYDPTHGVYFSPGLNREANGQSTDRPGLWQEAEIFWRLAFLNSSNTPPCNLPVQRPRWSTFLQNDGTDRFVWFGHSTILMHLSGQTVMIDPVFGLASPFSWLFPRWQPSPASRASLPAIDTILISHNHFDHLEEDTARFFSNKKAHYVVPSGLAEQLTEWGVPADHITELDWYQTWEHEGIRYTTVPAQHISGRGLTDTNKTLWAGWVIETPEKRYFYSGDTGYSRHFSEIRKRFGPFSLAFIENGQYDPKWADDHMSPAQTVQAAADAGAEAFVPVHWGAYAMAFHKWNDPVRDSTALAEQRNIKEITPVMGDVFTAASQGSHWWERCSKP